MAKVITKKINYKQRLTDDTLDLSLSGLEVVPVKEIVEIIKAKKLNLAYNSLISLPDDFIKLQHIREIDLSKNKLKILPRNFGALQNLKNLDLLGNQLTDLPSSFMELKALQWLDLKDNPLNPTLKQAAGDCLDEKQCKKCALTVMVYCKAKAVEEDRLRQIEAKKKKELQRKREAEEKEKANQLKLQKKLEREKRRIENEQKKKEDTIDEISNSSSNQMNYSDNLNCPELSQKAASGSCSSVISAFLLSGIFLMILVSIYVLFTSYCRLPTKLTFELRKNSIVRKSLEFVDENICLYTDKNSEFFNMIIKTVQSYI